MRLFALASLYVMGATLPSRYVARTTSIRTACVFFNTTRTPLSVSPFHVVYYEL